MCGDVAHYFSVGSVRNDVWCCFVVCNDFWSSATNFSMFDVWWQ